MASHLKVDMERVGEGVSIRLPGTVANALKPGNSLRLAAHGADAILLVRESFDWSGYFSGSLSAFPLGEVFGLLISGTRTGTLTVSSADSRRIIDFRDGQITFATSSEQHERLGAILVRHGWITGSQLRAALAKVRDGVRIGQVLTTTRALSPAALYRAMTTLVREIVIATFELPEGEFLFLAGSASTDAVKLPESTRTIVFEGMKRAEELERLRKRLPASTRVGPGAGEVEAGLRTLIQRMGKGGDLGSLRQNFDGGEHAFLTAIDSLLRSGALVQDVEGASAHLPPVRHGPAKHSALQLYAALIQAICNALRQSGRDLSDLHSFLGDPLPGMEEAFKGVTLSELGELDLDQVMKNMGASSPVRRARAYEALDAFMSYALFTAKNVMSPDSAEALSREYRRIQAEVRG